MQADLEDETPYNPFEISIVDVNTIMNMSQYGPVGVTTLGEIDAIIECKKQEVLSEDTQELRDKVRQKVPECYHDLLDGFSKVESDKLAPSRHCDHKIELLKDSRPEDLGYSPLYKMSLRELETCREYITGALKKGFIIPSSSPWAAPILFAPKSDGGLRLCVDYRKLNAITKKDRYPLPLIEETLARISKAKIFTKIDVRQAFHRIRMHPDSEDLTTFRTRYGAYKYRVVPFGLTNGPSTFQRYINTTLIDYLDQFCSAYIDDILIYSENLEEHREHVRKVLKRLSDAGLQPDIGKCEFHVTETKFLGFIIGTNGVAVDPQKVEIVKDWRTPASLKEVQSFLGFCNFYRKFILNYGRVALPLTNLTKKGTAFQWNIECQMAFDELKNRLLTAPVLAHFLPDRPTRVETDSSDETLGGVLSQKGEDDEWHPVAFYSMSLSPAERNYVIHDKELLAVIRALQLWRSELIGVQDKFIVLTDHRALEYFSTKRKLNARQARWAELMSQYHFELTYRPGTQNAAADALSRKTETTRTQKDKTERERHGILFRPVAENFTICVLEPDLWKDPTLLMYDREAVTISILQEPDSPPPVLSGMILTEQVMRANKEHESLEKYREEARQNPTGHFTMIGNEYLLYNGRLVVPDVDNLRTRVIEEAHGRLTTAHPGRNKTRRILSAHYWFPGLPGDVDRYVSNCLCRSAKVPRDKTPGLLQPLPIPLRIWQHIVVDFKKMPKDRYGYDNCLVMVDRLSKFCWSVPCTEKATAKDAALMYYRGPYRILGLPESVVSDRGTQFMADFMNEMTILLGFQWRPASAGHSQTAGQAENMNQYIDQRLRMYVNHAQDNWSMVMPALDHVQASLPHDSTGLAPHEVMFGFPMPTTLDWSKRTDLSRADMTPRERLSREDAQKMAECLKGHLDFARDNIKAAQDRMREQANRHRREPDFGPGDRVFIIRKTWSTDRPSDKLEFPMTKQHYEIDKLCGTSYLLKVPPGWRGCKIFHADRLRKCPNNPLPGQECERPAAEIVDDEEEWEVDRILASRIHYRKLQYQVQWKGWDPDPEYYPASDFKNAATKLKIFHDDNPTAPGPPKRLAQWLEAAEKEEFDPPHPDDEKPASTRVQQRRTGRRVRIAEVDENIDKHGQRTLDHHRYDDSTTDDDYEND
jgi:hypothetical protein